MLLIGRTGMEYKLFPSDSIITLRPSSLIDRMMIARRLELITRNITLTSKNDNSFYLNGTSQPQFRT